MPRNELLSFDTHSPTLTSYSDGEEKGGVLEKIEKIGFQQFLEQKRQAFEVFKSKDHKARNYMEEIAWRFVPKFRWTNETFEKDYRAFWMACNVYWKKHIPFEFERILSWGAVREVHPKAVIGVLLRPKPMQSHTTKYK